MRIRALLLAAVSLSMLWAGFASAVPVYGTSAAGELSGSRTVDGGDPGLTGFGQYATGFTVSWVIDFNTTTAGLWHYKYTFTGLDGSGQEKEISHFAIDLSDDCFDPFDSGCVTDAFMTDGDVLDLMDGTTVLSNCGDDEDEDCVVFSSGAQDGISGSVKFDVGGGEGVMYEFDSNRAPVYGHLAIKDGGGSGRCPTPGTTTAACSNGLLAGADTEDINDYVARPNGLIPEPGTLPLLAIALAGLGAFGSRHKRA